MFRIILNVENVENVDNVDNVTINDREKCIYYQYNYNKANNVIHR